MRTLLAFLLLLSAPALAVTTRPGSDQFGRSCDVVTWTDSTGQPRSVWIVNATPGAFISKMTYYFGATQVTATVPTTGFAFCTLVNHHTDNMGGAYTSSEGQSNPASLYNGGSTYAADIVSSEPLIGAHHLIWNGHFQMYSHPWAAADAWYITVQYVFTDGRDDFLFSDAYDSGNMVQSNINNTNLAPYCDFSFDGQGDTASAPVSGIGYGTTYKFLASGDPLSATSSWTYNTPNTIPFAWMYRDQSMTDRELGVVQNQPFSEKDSGYNPGALPAPPSTSASTGAALQEYGMPFQMNAINYAAPLYSGFRFTWGSQYTAFQNNHSDGLDGRTNWDVYPINAASFNILVDAYSSNGVPALISDTENIYRSSLTAVLGSVVSSGPKGPGDYVTTATGSMPTLTYTHPGFDFVMRAWRFNASFNGNAVLNLNAGGTLDRPTFIINQFQTATPCAVLLNGTLQAAGTDYLSSYDGAHQQLYLTFLKTLAQGSELIEVDSSCGTPSPTRTPCAACSPTGTVTGTPSATVTPTASPAPPCAPLLVDDLEDGDLTNALGGAWSGWATSPATYTAPAILSPGYPGSPYGGLHAIQSTGVNADNTATPAQLQVGSISTNFPSLDLGTRDRLVFWFYGTGDVLSYHVNVQRAAITDYDYYGANFTAPANQWTQVVIPLSTMAQGGWGKAVPMAWNDVTGLTWFNNAVGSYSMALDDISFGCAGPAPTASPTSTASPSATASATPCTACSPTPSPTATPTPGPCPVNPNPLLLKPKQRIFFIGDSITFRGNYTKQVQAYLNTIYPDDDLSFTNVGVGGWTATNFVQYNGAIPTGLNYVVAQHPDIATVCFGMNDAGYAPYDASHFNAFTSAMTTIITTLQAAGIQVLLLTPGIVDQNVAFAANPANIPPDYNSTLGTYAAWVMNYASVHNLPAFDIHTLALSTLAAARTAHPGLPHYTDQPQDGIHPNPSGGLVYAYGLLTALGVPYQCRSVAVSAGGVLGSAGAQASGYAAQANGCSFNLVTDPMPYIGDPQAAKILPFLDFQKKFNDINFTATGLGAASYDIIVDGYRAGPVSAAALASGINLLDYWIPAASSASQAHTVQLVDAAQYAGPACYSTLIDDMEHSNDFPPSPNTINWPQNLWGGLWFGGSSNGGSSTSTPNPLVMTTSGYNSSLAANLAGTSDLNSNLQMLLLYCYTQYDDPRDGIEFWFKGTAGQPFRVQCHIEKEDPPVNSKQSYDDYGYKFTTVDGNWHLYDIPWSSMTQAWAPDPVNHPEDVFSFDPGQITTMDLFPYFTGSYSMSLDNLSFYCMGQATPTPSPSPTRGSATPSATPSAMASLTPTRTPSPSATPSGTPVPPGSTLTNTPSVSPTMTRTESPTPTASTTPGPWASVTPSPLPGGGYGGTLRVLRALAVPDPDPRWVCLLLDGPAERCELTLYSVAMVRVATVSQPGPLGPGWVKLPLPARALPAGLYFGRVEAFGHGQRSLPVPPVRMVVL